MPGLSAWFIFFPVLIKKRIKAVIRTRMHDPVQEVGKWLRMVISGYYNYHAIPGNSDAMKAFRSDLIRYWYKILRRRGQKRRINWEAFSVIVKRWIPSPKVVHQYPNLRFDAKYLRQEPGAVIPHAGICAGAT